MTDDNHLRKIIHKKIANATVKVFVNKTFEGTGFFITHDGYLLTAYHCIHKDAQNIQIQPLFGEEIPAQFDIDKSLTHAQHDIAVLKTDYKTSHYLPLGDISSHDKGDDVVGIGYPAGHKSEHSEDAVVSGKISTFRIDKIIVLDGTIKGQGQSGGPVYHYATNRVIGLGKGGYKNDVMPDTGLAVPFVHLFQRWIELEEITNKVANDWDKWLVSIKEPPLISKKMDDRSMGDLFFELSEWKFVHNECQTLLNSMNIPINFMEKYRLTKQSLYLDEAGSQWQKSCVQKLKTVLSGWNFKKVQVTTIGELKGKISSDALREITRQLMQPDIHDGEFIILLGHINEIYGDLWELLTVADKQIMILIERLQPMIKG